LTLDLVEPAGSLTVESELRSIGEMARASGLSVSALRFYDGAGVLVPAMVDPATGYRWYADDQLRAARLVAGLRRVGMPLPDITRALAELSDPAAVRLLLDAHLRRLEAGLADARRELSRVHALLDPEETPMTRVLLSAADLCAALDAVRFAVSADPEVPMLNGVLVDVQADSLTLVATDRYRLAVARTPVAEISGPPVALIAPTHLIDQVRARPAPAGLVTVALADGRITIDGYGDSLVAGAVDLDFPYYRRLPGAAGTAGGTTSGLASGTVLPGSGVGRVTVDVAALRAALDVAPLVQREHRGVVHDLAVLSVDPVGGLDFATEHSWAADESRFVAVNRGFLLEALDAGGRGQLVLELDGPVRPLAVRVPDDEHTFSILMPVRR
jgi:DNA-binding transcriptional MerR regulator